MQKSLISSGTVSLSIFREFRVLLLGALCFTLPLLPIVIWNNIHSDSFILFTTNGGTTFKIANSYDSSVYNFIYPKREAMPLLSFAFIKHQFLKFIAFWNGIEYPQNVNFYLYRLKSVMLTLLPMSFSIIGALCISATIFFINAWRKYWLFFWFIWSYTATVVLFFIIARFRIPIIPVMAIFGTGLIVKLMQIRRITKKHKSRLQSAVKLRTTAAVAVFIAVFILSGPTAAYISPANWKYHSLYCLYGLDLRGYAYGLKHNIAQDKTSRQLNLCAAETFQGDFQNAHREIDNLLKSSPGNRYFRQTAMELQLIQNISTGKAAPIQWYTYLEKRKYAHIARFYTTLTEIFEDRRKFNLSTKIDWPLPESFFCKNTRNKNQ